MCGKFGDLRWSRRKNLKGGDGNSCDLHMVVDFTKATKEGLKTVLGALGRNPEVSNRV